MHRLRTATFLARWVLASFALTLLAAIASPMVHPQAMVLVCSDGAPSKWMSVDADGHAVEAGHHTLDCPMCLASGLPPPPPAVRAPAHQPLAHALRPHVAAHLAAVAGAPLPPRGPPAAS